MWPIALGPVTKSNNADTLSNRVRPVSHWGWPCGSGFWEVQVDGIGPVGKREA